MHKLHLKQIETQWNKHANYLLIYNGFFLNTEDCSSINLWHATDDSVNGVYQRLSSKCTTYNAFEHENGRLYMYHTDDYWVVNSSYSCDVYDNSNAKVRVLDGAYHPAEIENVWEEKDTSGTWKRNNAIDVACSGLKHVHYILEV